MTKVFPKFLKVVAAPVIYRNETTNETMKVIKWLDRRLVDIYSTALGFSYEIVPSVDGQYGSLLPNGSFTGAIGTVQRGEADIAISQLGITEERSEAVSFSYPYFIDRFTYATRKPEYSPKFLNIVYPFSVEVWFSILVCLVVMSIIFYILLREKFLFQKVCVHAFGTFVNQPFCFNSSELSNRLLLISWFVGVMFITYSYTAVLLSFLTLPVRERGIRTIPDLSEAVAKGAYQSATYVGIYIPEVLARAEEESLRIIGQDVKKKLVLISETEETVLRSKRKTALIAPNSYISFLKHRCFISEDNFFIILAAIPYSKTFCCGSHFTMATHRILAAGLHKKIIEDQDFMNELRLSPENTGDELDHELNLVDMSGSFFILITGYILSIAVLLLELVVSKVKKSSVTAQNDDKFNQ